MKFNPHFSDPYVRGTCRDINKMECCVRHSGGRCVTKGCRTPFTRCQEHDIKKPFCGKNEGIKCCLEMCPDGKTCHRNGCKSPFTRCLARFKGVDGTVTRCPLPPKPRPPKKCAHWECCAAKNEKGECVLKGCFSPFARCSPRNPWARSKENSDKHPSTSGWLFEDFLKDYLLYL